MNVAFPAFSETLATRSNGTVGLPSPLGVKIQTPVESSLYCRLLLDNSASPFAQMFAASRLKSLVLDHFSTFSMAEKLELSMGFQTRNDFFFINVQCTVNEKIVFNKLIMSTFSFIK